MTIFESIRQLLSQGDTAQALRLLIAHLEKENNNPEALRAMRVVEANYNAARQKEIKGILDFSDAQKAYSKANDALLSVMEDIAAGRKPVLEPENTGKNTVRKYWFIGGSIILFVGLIAGIALNNRSKKETSITTAEKPASECPMFDKKGVSIMVIPFQNLGDGTSKPELAILTRIRDLTKANNMASDVQILSGDRFEKNTPDMDDAVALGRQCEAQMVIWGQYEKVNEGISLDLRYVFTNAPNLPAGAISKTLRNLTELRSDRTTFNTLEDAIFSLCTALALHEGRMDLAEKWVNKMKEPNAKALRIKEILAKN